MRVRKAVAALLLISVSGGTTFAAVPETAPVVSPAMAVAPAGEKLGVINQIMADTGLDKVIEQIPLMAAAGFDQQPPPPVNRANYERFRESFLAAHDPAKIRQTVVSHFDQHYDAARASEFLARINTPLVKKITALEIESGAPQAQQEMMQMANIIMGQVSPARLALAQRLDEAQQAALNAVEIQMIMASNMMRNINTMVPAEEQVNEEQMTQMLEQLRAQSIYPARQYIQLSMVYAYRSVTDDELTQYIELYESELGRWHTTLIFDAFKKVSEVISADLSERMKTAFVRNNAL